VWWCVRFSRSTLFQFVYYQDVFDADIPMDDDDDDKRRRIDRPTDRPTDRHRLSHHYWLSVEMVMVVVVMVVVVVASRPYPQKILDSIYYLIILISSLSTTSG
jgi:hypothetical protein